MLSLFGTRTRYCDGVSRRSFLRLGAFAFGAQYLSLADLFRAEAQAPAGGLGHKSIINIFLGGGPSHQDTWDIKTEAPVEIRGEFQPIDTRVPGIRIGEVFPRIAGIMDQCAVVRSIVGASGQHDALQCTTGYAQANLAPLGGRPGIGPVLSKLLGPVDAAVPPFVGLAEKTKHLPWSDAGRVGFLGPAHAAFKPDGPGMANMQLQNLTVEQLANRKQLLHSFDTLRREWDVNGALAGADAATAKALDVLTSSKLIDALDVSRESEQTRARYGDGKPYKFQFDGAPTPNEHLLIARRLVEAGARCVTLSFGRWDSHDQNFDLIRDHGGKLDQCFSALIEDLATRGLLDDVVVIAWGEFGRSPKITGKAGRDHWPQVSCALLAGGGLKTGQVIGATNRLGEYAANRPVHFGEIFATLYRALGVNPETATVPDPTGRPQHLVEHPAMRELVG
jgi:hypothetical protein